MYVRTEQPAFAHNGRRSYIEVWRTIGMDFWSWLVKSSCLNRMVCVFCPLPASEVLLGIKGEH